MNGLSWKSLSPEIQANCALIHCDERSGLTSNSIFAQRNHFSSTTKPNTKILFYRNMFLRCRL
jgi:hypothetical protein